MEIGEFLTMEQMEIVLRNTVKKVDSFLDVQVNRTFAGRKFAGFRIINETHIIFLHLYMNWRKNCKHYLRVRQIRFCRLYISYVNGISITGASLSKMLSDKLYAISGESERRRIDWIFMWCLLLQKLIWTNCIKYGLKQVGIGGFWNI